MKLVPLPLVCLVLQEIESSDIVQGIVDRTKPDAIIAIDALASRSLERVNTTIQVADIGIHPGSGIGNKRRGLTKEILGVPCIAIGVPTVCYASTIVNNVIEMMSAHFRQETDQMKQIMGMLDDIGETGSFKFGERGVGATGTRLDCYSKGD